MATKISVKKTKTHHRYKLLNASVNRLRLIAVLMTMLQGRKKRLKLYISDISAYFGTSFVVYILREYIYVTFIFS